MNIYVGNLLYDVTEQDLQKAFESFGDVKSVNIVKDRYSGKSRGFGFVEVASEDEVSLRLTGLTARN